jgi:hypothetical protein
MKKALLVILMIIPITLAGCTPSVSVYELLYRYDLALMQLQHNPSIDLNDFENEWLWPYSGPSLTFLLGLGMARYVIGVEVVGENNPRWRTNWARIEAFKAPEGKFMTAKTRMFYDVIDLLVARRISFSQAYEVIDKLYIAELQSRAQTQPTYQ